jgi:hypothetical protein
MLYEPELVIRTVRSANCRRGHTYPSCDLVGFAVDEQIHTVMLPAQLRVEIILEFTQRGVGMPWNCYGCGLVPGCVRFDVVFQRVVVDVVWNAGSQRRLMAMQLETVKRTKTPLWYGLLLKLLPVFHNCSPPVVPLQPRSCTRRLIMMQ